MRSERGTQAVERAGWIGHPVTEGLIDGRAQRAVATGDGHHGGAHQAHAADVWRLARHVDLTHVDRAWQANACAGRGSRHTMLAGAGLGHHALRTHATRDQRLAQCVVDLVRTGVRQILALDQISAPQRLLKVRMGDIAVGRPTQSRSSARDLVAEFLRRQDAAHSRFEAVEGRHQCFGNVAPP